VIQLNSETASESRDHDVGLGNLDCNLLLAGNKVFGISGNLSHLCATIAPTKLEFFRYDWRKIGLWNLIFLAGVPIGGNIFEAYETRQDKSSRASLWRPNSVSVCETSRKLRAIGCFDD
jgi:hypothetical protein